ncbi:MAG TPA: polyphosphate kinase 1 [Flavobacteriales bacterium]|nr:polyphosphate kinase 1 [Flavobacteriales bacterium]
MSKIVSHKEYFINRDISWLDFNHRVLQEAENKTVPIIERVRFLGIFSNNLDEFFRVRVANIKRMTLWGKGATGFLHEDPYVLLNLIQEKVIILQSRFDHVYEKILKELRKENIYMIDEKKLTKDQLAFTRSFFKHEVRQWLVPIMLTNKLPFPELKDRSIYLAVKLSKSKEKGKPTYALIEIPSDELSRFVELPKEGSKRILMLLDDVVRVGLEDIFSAFQFDKLEAYTLKVTRDAELDISEDISESFMNKVSKSLKNRKSGQAVRFIYDSEMPKDLLAVIIKGNKLSKGDHLIPGGRYHNFKDFIKFPDIGGQRLKYSPLPPLEHPDLRNAVSLLSVIRTKDILLHFPFQSFDYIIDLLREAAINPNITTIKMTLYRAAENSRIIKSLINAAKNGKNVTVVIELQARFDEENNIQWARILQDEGIRVIFGTHGLKVHSKLILIREKVGKNMRLYAHVGTGNFHEGTAKIYTDLSLLTCDKNIANEVEKVFEFFKENYKRTTYRKLFVSPTNTRRNFIKLIETEIKNAKKGLEAYIIIKINNIVDEEMIEKLYDASCAGVNIKLIARGNCSLVPEIKGLSENIRATSIIDRFLEHTRIFVFCHGGQEKYYLSSADWMVRNLDRRIEATVPILDKTIQSQLKDVLNIYLSDNVKARVIDSKGSNSYVEANSEKPIRSQIEVYNYYKKLLDV